MMIDHSCTAVDVGHAENPRALQSSWDPLSEPPFDIPALRGKMVMIGEMEFSRSYHRFPEHATALGFPREYGARAAAPLSDRETTRSVRGYRIKIHRYAAEEMEKLGYHRPVESGDGYWSMPVPVILDTRNSREIAVVIDRKGCEHEVGAYAIERMLERKMLRSEEIARAGRPARDARTAPPTAAEIADCRAPFTLDEGDRLADSPVTAPPGDAPAPAQRKARGSNAKGNGQPEPLESEKQPAWTRTMARMTALRHEHWTIVANTVLGEEDDDEAKIKMIAAVETLLDKGTLAADDSMEMVIAMLLRRHDLRAESMKSEAV